VRIEPQWDSNNNNNYRGFLGPAFRVQNTDEHRHRNRHEKKKNRIRLHWSSLWDIRPKLNEVPRLCSSRSKCLPHQRLDTSSLTEVSKHLMPYSAASDKITPWHNLAISLMTDRRQTCVRCRQPLSVYRRERWKRDSGKRGTRMQEWKTQMYRLLQSQNTVETIHHWPLPFLYFMRGSDIQFPNSCRGLNSLTLWQM